MPYPDRPADVTDPEQPADRKAEEWLAELRKRVAYICMNYRASVSLFGNTKDRNATLKQVRAAVDGKLKADNARVRAHPLIEMVISHQMREAANQRTGANDPDVECADVAPALERTASALKVKRGAPADEVLRYHVEGLVALLEGACGKPIVARLYRGTDNYDPHFAEGISQVVPGVFHNLDPSIPVVRLVDIVRDMKQVGKGKRKSFGDYFPLYGARTLEDGTIESAVGYRIERFVPNIPIYFPGPGPG